MGYYTRFELIVHKQLDDFDHERAIRAACGDDYVFEETCKWYDHEKDMRAYSKQHPEQVFEIKGEGEEAGDLWIDYYQNGLMQRERAKITFEPFSPLKCH